MSVASSLSLVIDAGKRHSSGAKAPEQMSCVGGGGTRQAAGEEPRRKRQQLYDQGLPLTLIGCGGLNKDINSGALNSPIKRGPVGVAGGRQPLPRRRKSQSSSQRRSTEFVGT